MPLSGSALKNGRAGLIHSPRMARSPLRGTSRSLLIRCRLTAPHPAGTSLCSCPNGLQAFGRFVQTTYKPSVVLPWPAHLSPVVEKEIEPRSREGRQGRGEIDDCRFLNEETREAYVAVASRRRPSEVRLAPRPEEIEPRMDGHVAKEEGLIDE